MQVLCPSPRLRPPQSLPQEARGSAERPSQPEWNLTTIGADRVWKELSVRGQGIVVGQSVHRGTVGEHGLTCGRVQLRCAGNVLPHHFLFVVDGDSGERVAA